jgi:hypothetical protein
MRRDYLGVVGALVTLLTLLFKYIWRKTTQFINISSLVVRQMNLLFRLLNFLLPLAYNQSRRAL